MERGGLQYLKKYFDEINPVIMPVFQHLSVREVEFVISMNESIEWVSEAFRLYVV